MKKIGCMLDERDAGKVASNDTACVECFSNACHRLFADSALGPAWPGVVGFVVLLLLRKSY